MKEYMPVVRGWKHPFLTLRLRVMRSLTGKTNYFQLRHGFDAEDRKRLDLQFISHYHFCHSDNENTDIFERMRFEYYWWRYGREVNEVKELIIGRDFNDVPKHAADYMAKWQVFAKVPPFQVELFHGMDGQRFQEYQNEHIS